MLVKEMIEAISNKELKIIDLAKEYGCSDRTIQTKIKRLGFEWDSVASRYNFIGSDESVFDLDIKDVFKKASRKASNNDSKRVSKKEIKKEIKKANEEVATSTQYGTALRISPEIASTLDSDNNSGMLSMFARELASKKDSEIVGKIASEKEGNKTVKRDSKKASDNIDLLLAGKKTKKDYKGFYLDSDVASVIESVNSGVRSELVNECLRKVFKEKGLL